MASGPRSQEPPGGCRTRWSDHRGGQATWGAQLCTQVPPCQDGRGDAFASFSAPRRLLAKAGGCLTVGGGV